MAAGVFDKDLKGDTLSDRPNLFPVLFSISDLKIS